MDEPSSTGSPCFSAACSNLVTGGGGRGAGDDGAGGPNSGFVEKHPTVNILALSFLLLIGMTLVGEGLDQHIPKGYLYFAMAFSIFVETINLRVRAKAKPLKLRRQLTANGGGAKA
jgi:hypothetical protein